MITSSLEIYNIAHKFNSKIKEKFIPKIQRVYSTPHFLTLSIRFPGESNYLCLGRGAGYEGLWPASEQIPTQVRVQDKFRDLVKKHFRNKALLKITALENERAVCFHLKSKTKKLDVLILWKGRNTYYAWVDLNENIYYALWENRKNTLDLDEYAMNPFSYIFADKIGIEPKRKNRGGPVFDFNTYIETIKNKNELVFNKKKKKKDRKINFLKKDLLKVKQWKQIQKDLIAENIDLEPQNIIVKGIKFKFKKNHNLYQKKDIVFQKLKRLKAAEEIITQKIAAFDKQNNHTLKIESCKVITPVWGIEKKNKIKKVTLKTNTGEVWSYNGTRIWVGRNAHENDQLRQIKGLKKSIWVHLEGYTSGHAFIEIENKAQLYEILTLVGSLLRDYSELTMTELPLIYTEAKNLKGVKGRAGAVTVKKEKHIKVDYQKGWREILSVL